MMDLSTIEAGLLYTIKSEPGKTLTYYGDQLRMSHTHLTRALEKLVRAGYVERIDNKLTISDSFQKKEAEKEAAMPEPVVEIPEPVVEEKQPVAEEPAPVVEEALKVIENTGEAIKEYADKVFDAMTSKPRITQTTLEELLADGKPRTALEIAVHFGLKRGTSVAQVLRNMVNNGALEKNGTQYSIKADRAPAPVEPEAVASEMDDCELREAILRLREPFTAEQCLAILQRRYNLDRAQFLDVFEAVAFSNKMMAWDGNEFVDPVVDYSPDHTFIVTNRLDAKESIGLMDSYCDKIKGPYKLFEVVSITRLPPAEVLAYFDDMNYFTRDINNINHGNFAPHYPNRKDRQALKKGPVSKSYARLETLEQEHVKRFMLGGVAVDTFIRRFNIDPAEKARTVEILVATGLAYHDVESDYVFLRDDVEMKPLKLGDYDEPKIELPDDCILNEELSEVLVGCMKEEDAKHGFNLTEGLSLGCPTGSPPRAWTEQEKEGFVKALKEVVAAEETAPLPDLMIMSPDMAESLGINVDELPHQNADGSIQYPPSMQKGMLVMELEEFEKAKETGANLTLYEMILGGTKAYVWVGQDPVIEEPELEIKLDKISIDYDTSPEQLAEEFGLESGGIFGEDSCCDCGAGPDDECTCKEEGPHVCRCPNAPCTCDGPRGRTGPPGYYALGMCSRTFCKSEVPDMKWLLTLQMLEERLRFEHQYTQANQLKEIREYLENK